MVKCENYNKKVGNYGEKLAGKYLENNDYKIIYKNFMCKCGEIDIVAIKNQKIIFFEVKTRTNLKYGMPSEAVNQNKQRHICNVAQYFLYSNDLIDTDVRFDVIEILLGKEFYKIRHLKDVISM